MGHSSLPTVGSLPHVIGRYALYGEIASGGMATVHYGRLLGPVGFSRTVAIKRLHAQFAKDPEFSAMFLDEARLAARIRHPNVVQTLDVVAQDNELFLVMDYVQGESLGRLIRASSAKKEHIPLDIVSSILCGVLHGLHAAHEATTESGDPLTIVHRDVSPQNVLVGADGVPRVLDFGVAKAAGRMQTTREGQLKGKIAYMSPEQLRAQVVDRRTDVYAAGVVLWETLVQKHLFSADSEGGVVTKVLEGTVSPPSAYVDGLPPGLDAIVVRAIERDPSRRFETARQMALALETAVPVASPTRVVEWLQGLVGELLAERARSVAIVEKDSGSGMTAIPPGPPAAAPGSSGDALRLAGNSPTFGADAETKTGPGLGQAAARVSSPPRTGVSTISIATGAPSPLRTPARSATPFVVAAGSLGVAALAIAALVWRGPRQVPPVQATATPLAAAPPAAPVQPVVAAPSASAEWVPPPPEPSSAPGLPSAIASDKPPPAARRTPRPPPAPSPPKPAAVPVAQGPAPPPSASPTCTIQSYLDESGIKHFSKECK